MFLIRSKSDFCRNVSFVFSVFSPKLELLRIFLANSHTAKFERKKTSIACINYIYIQKGIYFWNACNSYGVMPGAGRDSSYRATAAVSSSYVDQLLSASFPLNFGIYSGSGTFHLSFQSNPMTVTIKTEQIISYLIRAMARLFNFSKLF